MLVWEDGYKIGNAEMDAQHLILFALLNQLNININDDRAGECLQDVLTALCAYIDYHFAHEEALMKAWDYPGLDEHAAKHVEFVAEVKRLQAAVAGVNALTGALKVRAFVLDWLLGHILAEDVEYVRHIAAKTEAA
ncbi:MAG TPA: hemerythrin family protein [Magnetospirillum sp.]|jgi:hemerythrin|nr:hemerythrin family protein [Magnetospirillum sp.]